MAGHCQLNIGNGNIFIYGGISSLVEARYQHYDNFAYIWKNQYQSWIKISTPSPCPISFKPPEILQQCSLMGSSKIVILAQNFNKSSVCTNIFNLDTLEWSERRLDSIPLAGFILTGFDPSRVFYIGGLSTDNRTVYELRHAKWVLTKLTLPYGMTGFDAVLLDSRLNLTQCKADVGPIIFLEGNISLTLSDH